MAFRIKFSDYANTDISNILRYISHNLGNPVAAERFYRNVNEIIEILKDNPYIYPLHHDEVLQDEGYHFAIIGNYLMLFLIDDNNSIVNIARIVYGRQNLTELLL